MIYNSLYDWQKKIVDKFKDRDSFGLFLEMGLGKTPLSLAFAEQNNCTKVLVITINSKALESKDTQGSWLNWASKSNITYNLISKSDKTPFDGHQSELFIINYESLFERKTSDKSKRGSKITLKPRIEEFIKSCKGHNVALIIDESHKVKDEHSLQATSIFKIQKDLKLISKHTYTYLLTGTPFTTGYLDLLSQLKLLGHTGPKYEFVDNYCIKGNIPGLLGWQQPIIGYRNIDALYDFIHQYALTIKSKEVIDLPEQIIINHELPSTSWFSLYSNEKAPGNSIAQHMAKLDYCKDEDIEFYKKAFLKSVDNPFYRNLSYPGMEWFSDTTGTNWLRARQISIGFQGNAEDSQWFDRSRLDELEKFLSRNENNYVLFYNYTPELFEIYEICERLGYNIDIFCGEIKSLHFYEKYKEMTPEERLTNNKNIIIANFASGSTGMNWQLYHNSIIFSLPLYKDYEQALKRIHRIGQEEKVIHHIFYQNNYLDKSMLKALREGVNYSQKMFDSDTRLSMFRGK